MPSFHALDRPEVVHNEESWNSDKSASLQMHNHQSLGLTKKPLSMPKEKIATLTTGIKVCGGRREKTPAWGFVLGGASNERLRIGGPPCWDINHEARA